MRVRQGHATLTRPPQAGVTEPSCWFAGLLVSRFHLLQACFRRVGILTGSFLPPSEGLASQSLLSSFRKGPCAKSVTCLTYALKRKHGLSHKAPQVGFACTDSSQCLPNEPFVMKANTRCCFILCLPSHTDVLNQKIFFFEISLIVWLFFWFCLFVFSIILFITRNHSGREVH